MEQAKRSIAAARTGYEPSAAARTGYEPSAAAT